MIPVVSTNESGALSYQIFNDALTDIEQINRELLATLLYAQQHLTDENADISKLLNSNALLNLSAINTAAKTLHSAVVTAVTTFETAVKNA